MTARFALRGRAGFLRHSLPGRLLARAALAAALGLALLALAGPASRDGIAQAAAITAPGPSAEGRAPGYELNNFRWDRTVVPVYYNWEGGQCSLGSNNFTGPAIAIPSETLLALLQGSLTEINTQLRGGLTLQLAGQATHDELCSNNPAKPIVVGFGVLPATGLTLSYGTASRTSTLRTLTASRVFVTTVPSLACPGTPTYRDIEHTFTHELLHAIGIGHSSVPGAMMTPTFIACRSSTLLTADDVAALAALYPPTQPAASTTTATRGFAAPVVFGSSGQALAVFAGGTAAQLEASAAASGASGVWVQDAAGTFRLLIVGGAAFLRDEFVSAFPGGLTTNSAVTLVR